MGYEWHRLHPFAFDCCIVLLCEIDLFPVQQSGLPQTPLSHYNDAIMGTMASQITSLTIINSAVYPGADQRKHQSSASLAFVQGIHRSPVNSPHKGPVTWKIFPFDDIIMSRGCFFRKVTATPISMGNPTRLTGIAVHEEEWKYR